MREAVGMDFGLMLECHTRYDTESAIQIAKAVEPFRPMWLEEPVPSDNPDAMAKVRSMTRSDCGGDNLYTRFGFRPYLEKQALSIIQPDMAKAGELSYRKSPRWPDLSRADRSARGGEHTWQGGFCARSSPRFRTS